MTGTLQLSARSVANLLARIFGPSIYDAPPFGGGDPGRQRAIDLARGPLPDPWGPVAGPRPEPWRWVMLNPQPLPPQELRALALADTHIQEILTVDRLVTLWGDEIAGRAQEQAFRLVAEVEELCPRWPRWPKSWPPPPPPPPEWGEEMTATALFIFGARFLAAAELTEHERLRDALTALGEKALSLSMRS